MAWKRSGVRFSVAPLRHTPTSEAWGFLLSEVLCTGRGTIIRVDSGRYRGLRAIKDKRVFVIGTTRTELRNT